MDKRIEISNQSVLALRDLLLEITRDPQKFVSEEAVIQALESQGLMAKYSNKSRCINSSSINTQKRIAENILEGGYTSLNKLRLSAQIAIEKLAYVDNQADKKTKAGLMITIRLLEKEKEVLRNDLLLLTLAFEKSLHQGMRYASLADASTRAICKKEQRELLDILSLRKYPANTNVMRFSDD